MEVLNFGECINIGRYKLHSKFKSVHNYTNGSELISLVSSQIGSGPNNIVLNNFPEKVEEALCINNSAILLGKNAMQFNKINSQISEDIFIRNINKLTIRIEDLSNNISDKIVPKSLSFLLFPNNITHLQTNFEKAYKNHVKIAVRNMKLDELPAVVKSMKGVGFGLTPSGDDFNCGLLYALNYIKKTITDDISKILNQCYKNSLGTNLISNTFLKFAYLNKFYNNFHKLLIALTQNNENEISFQADKIIGSGHTSGSDMLTGFILTIKGGINDKKFS